jgi:hypothetical protein
VVSKSARWYDAIYAFWDYAAAAQKRHRLIQESASSSTPLRWLVGPVEPAPGPIGLATVKKRIETLKNVITPSPTLPTRGRERLALPAKEGRED